MFDPYWCKRWPEGHKKRSLAVKAGLARTSVSKAGTWRFRLKIVDSSGAPVCWAWAVAKDVADAYSSSLLKLARFNRLRDYRDFYSFCPEFEGFPWDEVPRVSLL